MSNITTRTTNNSNVYILNQNYHEILITFYYNINQSKCNGTGCVSHEVTAYSIRFSDLKSPYEKSFNYFGYIKH